MKLLIATHNPAKLEDYKQFCEGLNLEIVSLTDVGVADEFGEGLPTFEDNAKAKAEHYYQLTKIPTLADDSGMEIPFYNMQPGVDTKHWDGRGLNDEKYLKFIVEKIKAIPLDKRQAQLRVVEAYCDGKQTVTAEGIIKGTLTEKIYTGSTTHGYPWDLVFIVSDVGKYYEEVTDQEHNHRKWAFDKIRQYKR